MFLEGVHGSFQGAESVQRAAANENWRGEGEPALEATETGELNN